MATAAEEWSALGFALGRRAGLLVALRLGLALKFGGRGVALTACHE